MAVRAPGNQLPDRVNLIVFSQLIERDNMVNVDESFPMLAVRFFEVESAALTDSAMMVDTGTPRRRGALIGVDRNNSFRAFNTEPGNR